MSKKEPVIEVKNLSKSYQISHKTGRRADTIKDSFANLIKHPFKEDNGDKHETFWALKDVSFSVNKGEVFGIVGRNGSGKSTMLKILSRIVTPTNGSADLRGRTASLLEVGTGFHPELSGRENIYFNGSMLGMSRKEIRKKFDEIVAFSEVEKFIDTPVKFYSSGMYVRLAFSVAAHLEPDILILDEVLSVGDAAFQKKSLNKIVSTMEDGRTVLFVSHSMGAVQQICSRGLLLNNGKVEFVGDVGELTERYMSLMREQELTQNPLLHEWTNDGSVNNDQFVPLNFYVTDNKGKKVKGSVSNSSEHFVNIEAEVKESNKLLTAGYALYNQSRSLVYMSNFTDENVIKTPLPTGRIHMRAKLPPNFLNGGRYRISIIAGIHNKYWIYEPGTKIPTIELEISGGLSNSEFWLQPREGAVAPIIKWEIQ